MKNSILSILALGASLLTAVTAPGQTKSGAPAEAPKQQKVALVATINSAEAYREFQNNVQVLQNERQLVLDLNSALEKEKDTAKKAELKTKLDAALAKLNQDNATMAKTYGFSLSRNYVLQVESAKIYVLVTDEEAAQIAKDEQKQAAAKKK